MKLKNTLPIAGTALSLLILSGGTQAQTLTPDPTLSLAFADDGGKTSFGGNLYVASQGNGIGFDPTNTDSKFIDGTSSANVQSFYDSFQVGANIASGQNFQIGVHGDAKNAAAPASPVTIFASIYNFNASAVSGQIPVGSLIAGNIPILITSTPNTIQDSLFFSGDVTLGSNLTTGSQYVIGFTPEAAVGTPATNFAFVDSASKKFSATATGNLGVSSNDLFETVNLSHSTSPTYTVTNGFSNPLGFRIYGVPGTTTPVPEASTVLSFGVLLAFGGLFLLRRRAAR